MATATRLDSPSLAPDDPRAVAAAVPKAIPPADDFVPPGEDILFEVIDNVVVECPPMGNREVDLANRLMEWMMMHVIPQGSGRVFSEPLFRLKDTSRHRRRPDIAFVSSAKWPRDRPIPDGNAWEMVPDLAVEVVSPTDTADGLFEKIDEYIKAGVTLVWVVLPRVRKVYVYAAETEVRILSSADELDGGSVLPGFRLLLARLFDGPHTPSDA